MPYHFVRRAGVLALAATMVVPQAGALSDVSSWAQEDIAAAQQAGLMPTSLADSSAREEITRAEFCAIAVKAYKQLTGKAVYASGQKFFRDTDDANVNAAYSLGLVSGRASGYFDPNASIERQDLCVILNNILDKAGIDAPEIDLTEWNEMLSRIHNRSKTVTIGLVGKYVQLHDAYLSVAEALRHAGYVYGTRVDIQWIDSETITRDNVEEVLAETLPDCSGVIVPGGFGNRGIEGKIITANYCRTHNLPYLGICLGMQVAVIAFARHAAGLPLADSGEFNPDSPNKVIDFLPDQSDDVNKGGTLRLGAYPCHILEGTQMFRAYGKTEIQERHRHRYEFNNDYRQLLTDCGLVVSGTSPDGHIVETVEVPENDFYIGVQYHPEFKSRPNKPHPLFVGLVQAALKNPKLPG